MEIYIIILEYVSASVNAVPMSPRLHIVRTCLSVVVAAIAIIWAFAVQAAPQLQLLMFERDGCSYCRAWNEQIGPAYPKTAEGRAAPLHRLDIRAPLPPGTVLTARPPVFTPTFVLLADGTEVGRIEGYAGGEFFWALLDRLLQDAGWRADAPAPADAGPQREAAPSP